MPLHVRTDPQLMIHPIHGRPRSRRQKRQKEKSLTRRRNLSLKNATTRILALTVWQWSPCSSCLAGPRPWPALHGHFLRPGHIPPLRRIPTHLVRRDQEDSGVGTRESSRGSGVGRNSFQPRIEALCAAPACPSASRLLQPALSRFSCRRPSSAAAFNLPDRHLVLVPACPRRCVLSVRSPFSTDGLDTTTVPCHALTRPSPPTRRWSGWTHGRQVPPLRRPSRDL